MLSFVTLGCLLCFKNIILQFGTPTNITLLLVTSSSPSYWKRKKQKSQIEASNLLETEMR